MLPDSYILKMHRRRPEMAELKRMAMTGANELLSEELIQQIEEPARTRNRKPAEVLEEPQRSGAPRASSGKPDFSGSGSPESRVVRPPNASICWTAMPSSRLPLREWTLRGVSQAVFLINRGRWPWSNNGWQMKAKMIRTSGACP